MNTSHTPGPWFLDQYGHVYGWDRQQPASGTSTSVHICTPTTNFADRARIVKCVNSHDDLLAALKKIVEEAGDQFGRTDGPGTINRMSYSARAALAKAVQ